jgi:fluoride exporter
VAQGLPQQVPRRSAALRWDVVAVVFLGGCVGGAVRYAVTTAWPAPAGRFPWATLAVNTAGAFLLGGIVVFAAELLPSRYLRPLLGTGFCGALTTFSSVVVSTDQLVAHRHPGTGAVYVVATVGAGLGAAASGIAGSRAVVRRHRRQERRRS